MRSLLQTVITAFARFIPTTKTLKSPARLSKGRTFIANLDNCLANMSATMMVGDVVEFSGDGWQLVNVPEEFEQVFAEGWGFKAVASRTNYPFANFMFMGTGGRFVTYSIVVYAKDGSDAS